MILVVNDDGIDGPGLRPLARAMRRLGRVTVVAPSQERSTDSHSLTLHKPLRLHRLAPDLYTLNGKPADCARLGILEVLKDKVSLLVSGINHGYNLGEDIIYSGTVAAAREATLLNVPAIAFSQSHESDSYAASAEWALRLARLALKRGLPPGTCLNVNFPPARKALQGAAGKGYKGWRLVRLGRRLYSTEVTRRSDPRGRHYYWLAGGSVRSVPSQGTDVAAVASGYASVTPLHIDCTDFSALEHLRSWF